MSETQSNLPSRHCGSRVVTDIAHLAQPVFLHSSFRTGSTWLWLKLRRAPTAIAYYEAFHELLATLTPVRARSLGPGAWASGHPSTAPYFLEYLPLLSHQGGICGFAPSMAFERLVPSGGPDGDLSEDERNYVGTLIKAAAERGRIPVVTCTRSLGRARALRRAFGGHTVFLHRNLFHQWSSYCRRAADGNRYFIDKLLIIAAHEPFLRGVADWLGVTKAVPDTRLFALFLITHLYLYGIAFDAADLVVGLPEIATHPDLRRTAETALAGMLHSEIDLSDVRGDFDPGALVLEPDEPTRDTIEQLAKLIPTGAMSPAAITFVERAKQEALAEWDRYHLCSRGLRSVLMARIDEVESHLRACEAQVRDRDATIDRLKAERAAVEDQLQAQREVCRNAGAVPDAPAQPLVASEAVQRAESPPQDAEISAADI